MILKSQNLIQKFMYELVIYVSRAGSGVEAAEENLEDGALYSCTRIHIAIRAWCNQKFIYISSGLGLVLRQTRSILV